MAVFDVTTNIKQTVSGRTAVRANLDVSTGAGELGRAVGQAGLQAVSIISGIRQKRQQMTDATSSVSAQRIRDKATLDFQTFKLTNPQETWEEFRLKQAGEVGQEIGVLDFSDEQRVIQQAKSQSYTEVETARALRDATLQLRKDTIDALTESLVEAFPIE